MKLSEKGSERRSEGGFGRYEEGEMGRKGPPWRSVGLRHRRLRGFSDSFYEKYSAGAIELGHGCPITHPRG
jgi:hypothetical protein